MIIMFGLIILNKLTLNSKPMRTKEHHFFWYLILFLYLSAVHITKSAINSNDFRYHNENIRFRPMSKCSIYGWAPMFVVIQ